MKSLLKFLKELVSAILNALSKPQQKDGPGGGTHPPDPPGGKG